MRLAIDFDGVIFDKRTSAIIEGASKSLITLYSEGDEITIFTNRPDYDYSAVKNILDSNHIPYDRIICGKPSYDMLIDDRAITFTGWDKKYTL